jgi:tyrosyl-tRNA synthetase
MPSTLETLRLRGFVHQATDAKLGDVLESRKITAYAGFDPTADSLHLGHLLPVMMLAHLQRAGHRVLPMIGGATGMVGDPSGRSEERNLLTPEQVEANAQAIRGQLECYLDFSGEDPAVLLNNYDWISRFGFIDWLRDVGKFFTINYMLAKESVKQRVGSESGLSFTEFSYMTMQAYDFLHLFENHDCTLQVGGSDQWGNITAGCDLIRKKHGRSVYGLTCPLVTTATGEKFGKSAGNAIWLDADKTSPWAFYQYFVRQDDRDVIRLLKIYTFMGLDEIEALSHSLRDAPEKREAHKALAWRVTALVHGKETADEMAHAAQVVYGSEIKDLSDATLEAVFAGVPASEVSGDRLAAGEDLSAILAETGLCKSKGEANRLLKGGGIYVNNVKVEDGQRKLSTDDLASESFIILRKGKKSYHLLRVS